MKYLSTFSGGCLISAQISERLLLHVQTTCWFGCYKQECTISFDNIPDPPKSKISKTYTCLSIFRGLGNSYHSLINVLGGITQMFIEMTHTSVLPENNEQFILTGNFLSLLHFRVY